jgi:hypothetical protein
MDWLWVLIGMALMYGACFVTACRVRHVTRSSLRAASAGKRAARGALRLWAIYAETARSTQRRMGRAALRFWVAEHQAQAQWTTHRVAMAAAVAPILKARARLPAEQFPEWVGGLIGPTVRPATFDARAAARQLELARALSRPMSALARRSTYSLADAKRVLGHTRVDWHAVEATRCALEAVAALRLRLTARPRVEAAVRAWHQACLPALVFNTWRSQTWRSVARGWTRVAQEWTRVAQEWARRGLTIRVARSLDTTCALRVWRRRTKLVWAARRLAGRRAMAWWSRWAAATRASRWWQESAERYRVVANARRVVARVRVTAAVDEWRGRGWCRVLPLEQE